MDILGDASIRTVMLSRNKRLHVMGRTPLSFLNRFDKYVYVCTAALYYTYTLPSGGTLVLT